MTTFTRRTFGGLALALASGPAIAQGAPREFRVGYQKTGLLAVARGQRTLERRLEPLGLPVRWVEFTAGPPLLEAMNVGSVDFGYTGDAPPIFAQAAGANIAYVAALSSNGAGEAIITKPGSGIASLIEVKGRKVGMTKGTSAHNLAVAALEAAGLAFADITPVYLSPADAGAAFARDSIDAWSIWDPFLAVAELRYGTRQLVTSKAALAVNTYALANRTFAGQHPQVVAAAVEALGDTARWADANREQVARVLSEVTGVELAAQTRAAERAEFRVFAIDERIINGQQATADRFHRLGLIPRAITVRDAVWTRPQT